MKDLKEQIDYEAHALEEMKNKNAEVPAGWSIDKQEGFVAGLKQAMLIVFA